MVIVLAVLLFALAFIVHGTGTVMPAWIAPAGLLYAGLVCVAVHLAGGVAGWPWRRP